MVCKKRKTVETGLHGTTPNERCQHLRTIPGIRGSSWAFQMTDMTEISGVSHLGANDPAVVAASLDGTVGAGSSSGDILPYDCSVIAKTELRRAVANYGAVHGAGVALDRSATRWLSGHCGGYSRLLLSKNDAQQGGIRRMFRSCQWEETWEWWYRSSRQHLQGLAPRGWC